MSDSENQNYISKNQVPVTVGMFNEMRAEFSHKFNSFEHRFESIDRRFDAVDKRFDAIDKRFEAVDKKFEEVDKRFDVVDKKFEALDQKIDWVYHDLKSDIHGMRVLMEEQNARNAIVLDGLSSLFNRQERVEKTVDEKCS